MEINNIVVSVVAGLLLAASNGAQYKLSSDGNEARMSEATQARSVATDAVSTFFMEKIDRMIEKLDRLEEELDEAEDKLLECRLGGEG